ncbi:MAG: MBL fold metallo-hydrolase [Desulfobacterales bacterium]|nr:MBL fold metallo-hydrolase [Desulfobacterales bacterium]
MPSADKSFRDLELLNVKIDVWVDEEDYDCVGNTLKPTDSEVAALIEKIFLKDNRGDDSKIGEKKLDSLFSDLFGKIENSAENLITISENGEEIGLSKKNRRWAPLFFAKYLRAKIQKNGTDNYTKHLVELVTYLQRNIPYQSTKDDQELILQHLYLQELSACGKPGNESLGFAVQAFDLIAKKKGTGSASHFSFELYKLWARLNQGIGFLHSEQKMNAALAFNEVIREFGNWAKCLQADEKRLWQSLLYDQAVLSWAELQEDLQFSYHTIRTLEKLNDRKKENKLIKEALAYRDIGRLKEAKKKIIELLSPQHIKTRMDSIDDIFEAFESWEIGNKKKNIRSKTLGLLFDYYLLEFQDGKERNKDDDIEYFIKQIKKYKRDFIRSKTERVSYYQQVARFLKWLSDQHKKSNDDFYLERIKELYRDLKAFLLPSDESVKQKYGIRLSDFGKYDYDRYTESMEKFFKNLTDRGFEEYKGDETDFLGKLNEHEGKTHFLFKFKKLERQQRINRLEPGYHEEDCTKPTKCFDESSGNSSAFDNILTCSKKPTCLEKLKSAVQDKIKGHHGSNHFNIRFGPLIGQDYEIIMERENSRFLDYLAYKSRHPIYYIPKGKVGRSFHFMGLQRWNSQTPTLTLSQGGGYLLYEQDEHGKVTLGIAIDPGFDFVDNLFHMGFTLNDIDFILLSHAHLDHIRDFEPIVTSLLDLKKRKKDSDKKIHAMMTWGVYQKLEHVIINPTLREFLADTYIVDIDKDLKPEKLESFAFEKPPKGSENKNTFVSITHDDDGILKKYIEIQPTQAYHDDYSERSDSYGYIINFCDGCEEPVFSFGYTGDTKWHDAEVGHNEIPGIYTQYKECDAVCIHLGALIESESEKPEKAKFSYYNGQHCEELIEKKQHPYLFGLLRYLKRIQEDNNTKNKLLLISEFGEELKGGIRIDFIKRLNDLFKIAKQGSEEVDNQSPVCLPVDIGLNVILAWSWYDKKEKPESKEEWKTGPPYKVWCHGCEKFVAADKIRYRHFGHGNNDEALFYFCNVCLKSKPENALQDRMRFICESGVPLEKVDE